MNVKDRQIIRDLAKCYMELAMSEEQKKSNQRMKDNNDLKSVRPPVLIDEIPWHELGTQEELKLICEDESVRWIEHYFRRSLYHKKHFGVDYLMPAEWKVRMSYDVSPFGIEKAHSYSEKHSLAIEDALEDENVLEQVIPATFVARPDRDEESINFYTELFGDVMPVVLAGEDILYSAFWDDISFYRGVAPIYEDMYERPEYLHQIMQTFVARTIAKLDFVEKHLRVDPEPYNVHCTPAAVSGLAKEGLKATWYRGMAQPFSCVSPSMFKEFELDYIKPIAERFGYTYYGCCEPLDDRIDLLKSIKNLRKVGVSPWANIEKCAELIGGDYVYARKPNPAHVAVKTDPDVVRRETEETVKACIKYGCHPEFVLKDITTVSNDPNNLIVWADTVKGVLDKYYGDC